MYEVPREEEERCKCCGQKLPSIGLPAGITLTMQQRRIWEAIVIHPGANRIELFDLVYDRNGGKAPKDNIISVYTHQINKKLRPHGIHIVGHRTHGYRIVDYKKEE